MGLTMKAKADWRSHVDNPLYQLSLLEIWPRAVTAVELVPCEAIARL